MVGPTRHGKDNVFGQMNEPRDNTVMLMALTVYNLGNVATLPVHWTAHGATGIIGTTVLTPVVAELNQELGGATIRRPE